MSASITDYRDGGKLVLTPIYLIVGLSLPVWLDYVRFGRPQLSSFAGLSSVGLGDSAASIIGRKFGRNNFFRYGKTLEGMLANFAVQLAFLASLNQLLDFGVETTNILSASFMSAALEATTDQIDNLLIPLVHYSLLSLAAES